MEKEKRQDEYVHIAGMRVFNASNAALTPLSKHILFNSYIESLMQRQHLYVRMSGVRYFLEKRMKFQ